MRRSRDLRVAARGDDFAPLGRDDDLGLFGAKMKDHIRGERRVVLRRAGPGDDLDDEQHRDLAFVVCSPLRANAMLRQLGIERN